jgi:hypothetical protein
MSEASDVRFHMDTFFVACNKFFFFFCFPGTMVGKPDTFEKNPLLEVFSYPDDRSKHSAGNLIFDYI